MDDKQYTVIAKHSKITNEVAQQRPQPQSKEHPPPPSLTYSHLNTLKGEMKKIKRTSTIAILHNLHMNKENCNRGRGTTLEWSVDLNVLGLNDTSTLESHFVLSPREREKRDRRDSRGDEREGQGKKKKMTESEETAEIKTFPVYPYLLQG